MRYLAEENRERVMLDFKALAQLILKDLNGVTGQSSFLKKYKRTDVARFLDSPEKNEKDLRIISTILYSKSSHYRRLIQYFAKLPLFYYTLEPVGVNPLKANAKSIQNQFQKISEFVELMNIKHEFQKIMDTAFKEDVFYGYEWLNNDTYFIQRLDPNYCAISSIEDGVFNFSFDFSFFDRDIKKLDNFPSEFKKKYNKYKNKTEGKWQELDSEKTICIKINEGVEAVIPPFAGVFDALFDIEDYKSLRKTREEIGNYKILVQKIPMKEGNDAEGKNEFLIDFEYVTLFHNKTAGVLPDNVGLVTSPMEISDISFDRDKADIDNVSKAERDYWGGAGVSQHLFNSDKTSSIGLGLSLKTDEQIIFSVLRQCERWLNRRIRKFINKPMFKIQLLNITYMNQDDVFEKYLEASQFGIPVKMLVGASLGISPSSLMSMAYLENEVFGLHEKFIPLSSSHTSTNDEGGRPKKKDTKLSPSGETTRENDSNAEKQ